MPERHCILQENAASSAASAFIASESKGVGSIFLRSGELRAKSNSHPYASCLFHILATLASVAAIAVLVSVCSSVYTRHGVQNLLSRRLASSEDSDVSVCSIHSDGKEQHQPQNPGQSISSGGKECNLPLKKRLLARVAGGGNSGDGDSSRQQEALHHHGEGDEPFGSPLEVVDPTHGGRGHATFPGRGQLPSAHVTRRMTRSSQQQASGLSVVDARQAATEDVEPTHIQRQQQDLQLVQWKHSVVKWHRNQEPPHTEPLLDSRYHPYLRQRDYLESLRRQRHVLIQLRERQKLLLQQQQQQLLELQTQQQGRKARKKQQEMQQQEQGVTPQEKRQRQGAKRKRKRKQQEQPAQQEKHQAQPAQPEDPVSAYIKEDAWLSPDSQRSHTPPPRTSQQALQSPAAAPVAGPSTSWQSPLEGIEVGGHSAPPTSGDASVSRDEVADSGEGATVANGATIVESPDAVSSSDESTTARGGMRSEAPILSALLAGGSIDGARAGTAGTEEVAPGVSFMKVYLWNPDDPGGTPGPSHAEMMQHPFVRLPRPMVDEGTALPQVDLKHAVEQIPGRRDVVLLLQRAHDLLLQEALRANGLKQLTNIAMHLISHAMNHQTQKVSDQKIGRAVDRLGVRFLLLDVVVSTLLVLGQEPAAAYWQRFVDAMPHDGPAESMRQPFSFFLAQDLSSAMVTLKTGRRPPPHVLLKIKRMLFCTSGSPFRYRRRDFDRWRIDDRCHLKGI
ncbi:hypothetical protein EAH_00038170 [Eimeria acervulina]|uniref:Uncharacterized protein n=1 Tax=Eimeria acervulina TaxID=5801 RepID=U6GF49_EIMAC|nr:hypothetical protein EAH_00038170 [Eimeria acervulina]CDI78881.1 hypothetical protein EAH_00038170 [Eimeria acervulina]